MNESYYCNSCGIDFQPDNENARRESKLSVPSRNPETLVSTTPGQDYLNKSVEINHTTEPLFTPSVYNFRAPTPEEEEKYNRLLVEAELASASKNNIRSTTSTDNTPSAATNAKITKVLLV